MSAHEPPPSRDGGVLGTAEPAGVRVSDPAAGRSPRFADRRWRLAIAVAILTLLAAGTVSAASVDGDTGGDVLALGGLIGADLLRLRWQFAALVAVLAGLHYLAAAVAARAASGLRLPMRETVLVQLAAAAADRVTPGGVGAAAVNARYFSRRGLPAPAALGAVTALHVPGPISDLALLAFLVLAGRIVGLYGGSREFAVLASNVAHLLAPLRSPWLWSGLAVAIVAAALVRRLPRRRPARDWRSFRSPIRQLLSRPASLAALAAASGGTTLILAFAFAASVAMVPGRVRPARSVRC